MLSISFAVGAGTGWFIAIIILFILAAVLSLVPIKLWILAFISGARVSMMYLVSIRLRKVPVRLVVETYIKAKKADLNINVEELSNHYLAGGNISNVVDALISARSANLIINFDIAKAIDLAGLNVYEELASHPR